MTTQTHPIVGAHFRPPAKAVLQVLPSGADLWVEREPENFHDPNAAKVLCSPQAIPPAEHQDLEVQVLGYGFDLAQVLAMDSIHLGYIPRDIMLVLAPIMDAQAQNAQIQFSELQNKVRDFQVELNVKTMRWPGVLVFTAQGKPAVSFNVETDTQLGHAEARR